MQVFEIQAEDLGERFFLDLEIFRILISVVHDLSIYHALIDGYFPKHFFAYIICVLLLLDPVEARLVKAS